MDAIRDARVLMAILAPLAVGILYNVIYNDQSQHPQATVAYVSPNATGLIDALRATTGETVSLTFVAESDESALRQQIADKKADVGLILPAGFDAAVAAGQAPAIGVVLPANAT